MSDVVDQPDLISLKQYQAYVPGRTILDDEDLLGNDLELRSRLYSTVQEPAPVPALPQHTLTFVYAGEITGARRSGDDSWQTFDTRAGGHVTLRPAGRSTNLRWEASHPVRTVSLYLTPERLERAGLELGMAPSRIELRDTFNVHDPLLRRIAEEFRNVAAGGRAPDPLYLQTALQLVTVHLLHRYATTAPAEPDAPGRLSLPRLLRVERLVRARLDTDLSLDDLAGAVGLSKYHFSRRFKQRTGQSPYQFVIYERVREARRLLRETDDPLAQIALQVGFSSQSHFTRTFKRHVGATPGRYRAAWR